MKKEQMEYGIVQYGTPLYVFDTDILEHAVRDVRRSLGEAADLCFAMKANPFLVKTMADMTDRVEVCSAGELNICRARGLKRQGDVAGFIGNVWKPVYIYC